jgi:hypothetical protein
MQTDLLAALASKARLAALGEAVAKINHDLRNMLTSAQMASDRLAALGDPKVAQALPRLERALDRAITLASDVMAYGKSKEPEPVTRIIPLRPALDMAAEDAGLTPGRRRFGDRHRSARAGAGRSGPAAPHPDQPAAQRPRGHRGRARPRRQGQGVRRVAPRRGISASCACPTTAPACPSGPRPTCSSRSSARCGAAARAWGWPSPASWRRVMAAIWRWSRPAPAARCSTSPWPGRPIHCRSPTIGPTADILSLGERPWRLLGP